MIGSGRAASRPTRQRRAAAVAMLCVCLLAVDARAQGAVYDGPTNQAPAFSVFPGRPLAPPRDPNGPPRPAKPNPIAPRDLFPPYSPSEPFPPPRPRPRPRENLMPNVTGMPLAAAIVVLAQRGLQPAQIEPTPSDAPARWVVDQQPPPGQPVTEAPRIVLSVSEGALTRVPDLRGLTAQDARQALRAAALAPGRQDQAVSDRQPAGRILATRPGPGAQVRRGASVDYEIARAPPPPPVAVIPPPPPPPRRPPPPPAPIAAGPAPITPAPPVASAAPASPVASASPASALPPSAAAEPPSAPAPRPSPGFASQPGLLGWAETHPGWLAALAVALATGAAAAGWRLRRRPPAALPGSPPVLPVTVAASLLTAPHSTLETVGPPPGPAIGIAWRLDPPDPRLETTPEEPSP